MLSNRSTALVGISPGNSYFKQQTIEQLLDITTQSFSNVYIVIPDKPTEYTYKALGYVDNECVRRAHEQSNRAKNRVIKSIGNIKKRNSVLQLLDWQTDIGLSVHYQKQLRSVDSIYRNCKQFSDDLRQEVKQILSSHHESDQLVIEEQKISLGAQYVLDELAFCLAAPGILQTDDIAVVYHKEMPLWHKFFCGYYTNMSYPIGLVIIS